MNFNLFECLNALNFNFKMKKKILRIINFIITQIVKFTINYSIMDDIIHIRMQIKINKI